MANANHEKGRGCANSPAFIKSRHNSDAPKLIIRTIDPQAFPGVEHLQKAKALLRMAGFADDQESRAAIQRMAEVHMAAAQAARTVHQ